MLLEKLSLSEKVNNFNGFRKNELVVNNITIKKTLQ